MIAVIVLLLAAVPAAIWLYTLIAIPWQARRLEGFDDLPTPTGTLRKLNVVIAARNEAIKIEAALLSLLNEDYPGLEIIVVNDRSTDDTGAILDRLADSHPQLRVIHVTDLPCGWLGKNFALQKGLEAAHGEFVLFTDADVHFKQNTLRRAVAYMQSRQLDHLASLPALLNAQPSMRLMLPAFSVFFLQITQPWKARDPESERHIGVGAFNLVRRSAVVSLGGFEAIRLRPDDDLMLARLLKSHGCRADFVLANEQISVEWYRTAGETIRGLEKNSFAHFNYAPMTTSIVMLLTLYLVYMPIIGLVLLPGVAGWLSLAGCSAMLLFAMIVARMIRLPALWGLLFPVGSLLIVYATLRSMYITLRQGGIVWRDTFYPLDELRSNRP